MAKRKQPTVQDFRFKDIHLFGATNVKTALLPGDLVVDKHNVTGVVKYTTEKKGSLIRFIDGSELFDKDHPVKKLQISSPQVYEHQERYFGYIVRLGKIIAESLKSRFPYVNMYNNGNVVFVRASTLSQVVKSFTYANIGESNSYISIALTPFWNFELEQFDLKKQLRKSHLAYFILRDMFIDIDLGMPDDKRIKWTINDNNEYNEWHWRRIIKQFKRYKLNYIRK